ncbi:hypothetical protein MKW98_028588 [Papaver atlanticum]|uniref:RING-CH-type domain-containing protein n=1 Tax=Papaver atlanticum TaxID=357466 RepID=A0AAD4TDA7_9MAGN|nr:hypothetical protein MKW98_028588 [Papaver atlanticum]
MGDHFVLLVDRLLTESTLEAALESRNLSQQKAGPPIGVETATLTDISSDKMDFIPGKLVECRICQDEDHDSKMETPCSCCGSLKYAHRRCVQRWCNEKGDTICEICHQPFKPGYTAPPPLFHYGGIPMSFRGNWEIPRRELYNPRFIAMVSTDRSFLDGDYDDYSSPTSRSLMCCRTVAIIFVVLLVLRHALPIIISETEDYSFTLFMLLLLRISGILLPIYLTIKAVTAILRRRRPHEPHDLSYSTSSGEEDEQTHLQPQQHLIHVH